MCSTSHSSGGGDTGGYGGDSIYTKKPKRQRVPKRGPGVAELEKILREQEKKTDLDKSKYEGFSLVSSLSSSFQHHHHPQLSLPKPVSFSPNPSHFSPPTTTFYSNNSSGNGGKSGFHIAGSEAFLPEHALLPTTWNSCEATSVDVGGHRSAHGIPFSTSNGFNNRLLIPSPNRVQRSQHSPPSVKNLFPQNSVVSSPTTTSTAAAPCHGGEPPSNQTSSHHCPSLWPEEDKIVGAKRSRPFSMEIPPVPPFRYQIHPFSPQLNLVDSSLPFPTHNIINLESTETISRKMNPSVCSLELNITKCNTKNGASDGNFLLFGSPTSPPSTQRKRPKFDPFPFQESNVDYSHHMSTQGGFLHKKQSFYSFLSPREQMGMVETNISLNNERVESRGDGVDLNLKL